MADVNDALAAHRAAVLDLAAAAERSAATWTTPGAPGKWSPSQVVEHVARGLEEGANVVSGAPSIPMPPAFLRPLLRLLFFNRILRKAAFPKGFKAHKAMNPTSGPATPAEARPSGRGARQVRPGMLETGRQWPTRREHRIRYSADRRLREV